MSEQRGNMNLASIAKFALPNGLTLARLAVGLVFFWLPASWRLGAVIFAGLSDLVDGWFSRHLHATSVAGKILDPIADKTCVLAVIITLLYDGKLRFWELLLVAQRDIIVLGSAIVVMTIARHKFREMPPHILGKVATASQFVFLIGQLALESPPRAILIVAAVLSGLAGLDYLYVAVTSYRAYKAEDEAEAHTSR
jgi:cardiolipin synthase